MGYHSTTGTSENRADFHQALTAFLQASGWTMVHETTTGNPFSVFLSPGESGDQNLVIQTQSNSGQQVFNGFQSWSISDSQGRNVFGNTYNSIPVNLSTQMLYWLFADLDHIVVVTKVGTTYHYIYAGLLASYYDKDYVVIPAATPSGSGVTITASNSFSPGQPLMLMDSEHIERVQVSAATPTEVTLESVSRDYAENARLGTDPYPVIITRAGRDDYYAANVASGYHSAVSHSGTITPGHGNSWANYSSPNGRTGKTVLFPFLAGQNVATVGELRGELIETFAVGSSGMDSESVVEIEGIEYIIFNLSGLGWAAVRR